MKKEALSTACFLDRFQFPCTYERETTFEKHEEKFMNYTRHLPKTQPGIEYINAEKRRFLSATQHKISNTINRCRGKIFYEFWFDQKRFP